MRDLSKAVALSVLVLSSCTRSASLDPVAATELRIHLSGEPASADPSLVEDGLGLKILSNTAETLVGYTGDGKLVPRAAQSWTLSPDGRNYRFQLKPRIRWSDGVELIAEHFKTGLERTLDPMTGARLAPLLEAVDRVFAPSPGVLEIRLKRKAPYFLKVLTLPITSAQRADVLLGGKGKWPITAPTAALYGIRERKLDREWRIEANPMRTSELSSLAPRGVRLVLVSDEITALALFEQKSLDVLSRVPPFEAKKLKSRGLLQVQPFWATYYLGFNTQHPKLAKSAVRCALARAIKKSEIVTALESDETVAASWVPPELEGFYEKSTLSGAPRLESGLKFHGVFDSNSRNQLIMEKIQADLKAAGVEVSLTHRDWKTYLRELKEAPPDLFRMGWLAAFPDPISHLQALTTKNPNNLTRWSNPQYDRLVSQVEALEEGPERRSKVIEAQKIAVERDCAVVPLYHYVQVHGVSPRVLGYRANGMGVVRWENVSLRAAP